MSAPKVTIIIVNWNGRHWLETCIPSVLKTTYPDFDVLVVDNGSADDSQEYLRCNYPDVGVIETGRNLGFAEGNNIGIKHAMTAGADYVALLNNDTRVSPEWLSRLVAAAESDPSIALCEARQLTWNGEHHVCLRLRVDWLEGELTLAPPVISPDIRSTLYAAGCCVLIRCTALKHVGLFDPSYFAYVEDVDLSLRVWIAGYRVVSVGDAVIYHYVSGTAATQQRMSLGYRNQLLTMFRNYELSTLFRHRRSIVQRWFLTRNRMALRETLNVLLTLPRILSARRAIQRMRQRSDREIFDLGQANL